ncbi:MAG: hypothetical protein ACE5QF_01420 [Thermoplasmata archaeon]
MDVVRKTTNRNDRKDSGAPSRGVVRIVRFGIGSRGADWIAASELHAQ